MCYYVGCCYSEYPNAKGYHAEFHYTESQNAKCGYVGCYAEYKTQTVVFLSVIMLSIIMKSIVMLDIIMLGVKCKVLSYWVSLC